MSERSANERRSRRPAQPWWQRHRRAEPRLEPRWQTDNLLNDAVRAARRVYDDRDRAFPELLKRRRGRASKRQGTQPRIYTVTRKRSDRSEAQARALAFLVGHCDLESLQVGAYRKGGGIAFYDLERLAQGMGISPWQLDRVISDFRACGWIYRHQARDLVEDPAGDRWSSHVAILKLTTAALEACGVTEAWREAVLERRRQQARIERERAARSRQGEPTGIRLSSAAADVAVLDVRREAADVPDADRPAYNQLLFQLRHAHDDWPDEQLRAEARRRLGVPPPPDEQR